MNFHDFQVTRGEFFSHIHEPSLTFSDNKIYVNAACLKKLPDYDYIQILIHPKEKKLAVKPCPEARKDSFRWCMPEPKRTPKKITCHIFFAKVMLLMNWNAEYRYKLLGKLVKSKSEQLFIFDLNTPEIYQRHTKMNKNMKSDAPIYPKEWENSFGLPVEEHSAVKQIRIFDKSLSNEIQGEQQYE